MKADQEGLMLELGILKHLDHPNIVKFYETYEDDKFLHFVMEYCSGGELLDRVIEKGSLNEHEAAVVMEKALSAVKYLHEKKIVHRDLKPENFLFSHMGKDAELKLIDFGLARPIDDAHPFKTVAGTVYYLAPEVIKGNYNEKCDEWSLGAVMYLLLSGNPPFIGNHNKEIMTKILTEKVDMKGHEWKRISKHAKDLILKLLERNVAKRLTAAQALEHPWLKNKRSLREVSSCVDLSAIQNLRVFNNRSHFRKEALAVIVNLLSESELMAMKNTFNYCDKTNTGEIKISELHQVMLELGYKDTNDEIGKLIRQIHIDERDHIGYTEFLAAALDNKHLSDKEKLWTAFKHFDVNNSGYITKESLAKVMARGGRKISEEEVEKMIREVDSTNDGKITFEEFCNAITDDVKGIGSNDLAVSEPTEEEEAKNDVDEGDVSRKLIRKSEAIFWPFDGEVMG